MYQYVVKGEEDFKIGQAKKIGKAIAVIVDKEWLGARVVLIREGHIKLYVDIDDNEKVTMEYKDFGKAYIEKFAELETVLKELNELSKVDVMREEKERG